MPFIATEHAFEAIRCLSPILDSLKRKDADLADQIRRAATSIVLNLEEGSWKSGRDRINRYRIAAGSAAEVRAALKVAAAMGWVEDGLVATPINSLDQMLAIVWRIAGKGR